MGLKAVVIEQDPDTLRVLQKEMRKVAWECEIVGTAATGQEGLLLAQEKKPGLVFCAVDLPGENGLEIAAQWAALQPDCAIILMAKEKNFDHALQAIRLGVYDYLLKPLQPEEMESAVRRAAQRIRRTQEAQVELRQVNTLKRQAQLLALLTNDSQRGQGVNDMLVEAQLGFEAYYIMVVQLPGERAYTQQTLNRLDGVFARKRAQAVSILLYDSVVVFVRRNQADAAWRKEAMGIAEALMDEMKTAIHVSSSQLHTSRHAIRQAYYQARQALWEIALSKQERGLAFYQETQGGQAPSERVAKTYRRINELIEEADLSHEFAAKAAAVLVELSGHQYSNLRAMISLYTMALQKKFSVPPDRKTDAALYNTWFVSSENDARECLLQLSAALRELQETPKYSLLVRNTIQYINLHAIEGPQLGEVAEKMCVSANYLSALMRKETGVTFHEHVLEAKMAVARSMLADPRVLVEEVARAVGYGNYISFYNAFKRVVHMTPSEFRNQKAGE